MATCEKCKLTYSVFDKDATDMLCSRCSTGKPPEEPELNESDQIATGKQDINKQFRNGSRKLPVWLCILLAHIFASYMRGLTLPIIDYFRGYPITSGSFGSFGNFIRAPIDIIFYLLISPLAFLEQSTFVFDLWVSYICSFALCYILLNWYAKRKRKSQQN